MAVGRLNTLYRSDALFGFTFLCTRIFYFGRLTLSFYMDLRDQVRLYPFCVIIMGLHVHWLLEWIRCVKQGQAMETCRSRSRGDSVHNSWRWHSEEGDDCAHIRLKSFSSVSSTPLPYRQQARLRQERRRKATEEESEGVVAATPVDAGTNSAAAIRRRSKKVVS